MLWVQVPFFEPFFSRIAQLVGQLKSALYILRIGVTVARGPLKPNVGVRISNPQPKWQFGEVTIIHKIRRQGSRQSAEESVKLSHILGVSSIGGAPDSDSGS